MQEKLELPIRMVNIEALLKMQDDLKKKIFFFYCILCRLIEQPWLVYHDPSAAMISIIQPPKRPFGGIFQNSLVYQIVITYFLL